MDVIINGRGTGKTKLLFDAARKNNGIILAYNKRAIKTKAHEYGYDDLEIIDYEDLNNDDFSLGKKIYSINGDKLLNWLMETYYNIQIGGFTATTDIKD